MILVWRRDLQPLSLRWRGPNRLTTAVNNMTEVMEKIAVIAGPRGNIGPIGPKGDPGITTVVHEPLLVLDGGNY